MNVIELDKDTIKQLKGRKLCIVELSISCLEEIVLSEEIFANIEFFVDENPRKLGVFHFENREFIVYPLFQLTRIDFNVISLIITSDYYYEYLTKIKEIFAGILPFKEIYIYYNYETSIELKYRLRYKNVPLENIIIFRSGPPISEYIKGMDFSDNARALFEYMLTCHLNKVYKIVWLVNNPADFNHYNQYNNVCFLPYAGSSMKNSQIRDAYYQAICLAKYVFFTDAYGFSRNCRSDQIRVQLWHGCGFKSRLNHVSCQHRYEYMPVTSKLYADVHAKEFGLNREQMLVTGLPKEDWLFEQQLNIYELFNIASVRKFIFWLPTYRFSGIDKNKPCDGKLNVETGLPLLTSYSELVELNKLLLLKNCALIIKPHPFQDNRLMNFDGLSNIIILDNNMLFEKDIQVNQLLSNADALFSDYSSVAVDYIMLDRPMAFITADENDYSNTRGFVFENLSDYIPGAIIQTKYEMFHFIEKIADGVDLSDSTRRSISKRLNEFRDGNSCKRLLEALKII